MDELEYRLGLKKIRLILLYIVLFGLAIFLATGMFWRQIICYEHFLQKERHQNLRRILVPAPRGNIYDRNGNPLAHNSPSHELLLYLPLLRSEFNQEYVNLLRSARASGINTNKKNLQIEARKNIIQKYMDQVRALTHRNLSVTPAQIERHYNKELLLPFVLMGNLTDLEYVTLVENIAPDSPLRIGTEYVRSYPRGTAACHVIGYVTSTKTLGGLDNNITTFRQYNKLGKAGIELIMNDLLSGTSGEEILSVDPSGFKAQTTEFRNPEKGQDCYISIDIDLQQVAETSLGDKIGSVVVLDVRTGEVLVMASKPNYDLGKMSPRITNEIFSKISAETGWLNRSTQGLYPPGSTFKLLSAIAFLKSGTATWDPADTELCQGSTMIGTGKFRCDNHRAHGKIGLHEAIKKSCNVYFYNRSQKCGIDFISKEAHRFGLDSKTGLELPYETSKMIVPTKTWKIAKNLGPWLGGDTANTSIGQGYLRLTPLQMACFTASVARNETRTTPHIIHEENRPSQQGCHEEIGLSNDDYTKLISAFEDAVNGGTCWRARIQGLRVAGKTGTAQVWENGKKRNVAWFIGFAPVEDPQIAIAVAVQEKSESDSYYGSTHAAPLAKDTMEYYFSKFLNKIPCP
ncbi:MAG: hypothetical protein LBB20_00345 [Puniceicoccales bacterium]|jgi:penicillin-binding protein 2|nr:hypothetical protein [Puniceicoccales bacterium]